ncbi:acid sphingomyelinase-like phosphodiesterase 3b [Grus japonensis]|uniref:Acid sphingomyelinase-like phosphodiesterase 3b n=1 Tax=Grus japonensis TaxID=30415 RepID=A0ABC9WL23_GRUJA
MEKIMVRQAVALQPTEVHSGPDIHLQPMEDPTLEQKTGTEEERRGEERRGEERRGEERRGEERRGEESVQQLRVSN